MRTRQEIYHNRAETFAWMKQTGVWWIAMVLMGAVSLWFLYRYFHLKNTPMVSAKVLDSKEQKGSHSTVTYLVRCEYTDLNGGQHTANYTSTKAPEERDVTVYIDPDHPDRIAGPTAPKSSLLLSLIFGGITVLGVIAGML